MDTTAAPVADRVDEVNDGIAALFRDAAALLESQGANAHRVRAYRAAAVTLADMERPVSELYEAGGLAALIALPTIGRRLAVAIADILDDGNWSWFESLRGDASPEDLFAALPGVGPRLAQRLHDELHAESLEELEAAAHDGRLADMGGFGPKRVQGIVDALEVRLRRRRWAESVGQPDEDHTPTTAELLDVDAEYRELASADRLPLIAPRRFNPSGEAWLPVLHTSRGDRDYTALFSNTARAHALGRTDDWVVIHADGPAHGQWTVVTETSGPRTGQRVVRGR